MKIKEPLIIIHIVLTAGIIICLGFLLYHHYKLMEYGEALRQVGYITKEYLKINHNDILLSTSSKIPTVIPLSELDDFNKGNLMVNNDFIKDNFTHNICVLVLQPSDGSIQALVVTEGGKTLSDNSLNIIASIIGVNGGGIYQYDNFFSFRIKEKFPFGKKIKEPIGNYGNSKVLCKDGITPGNIKLTTGHPFYKLY